MSTRGGGKAELTFFSLHCVCETPYVCLFMYLCMCFLQTPDYFHACFGCTAEAHTQQLVLAPSLQLHRGRKTEAKANDCYSGEAGGCPKQDQMQGSWRLLGLIEEGSVAPVEPLTGFTEAWQTGQFPLCTPYNTMNTTAPDRCPIKGLSGKDIASRLKGHKGTYE